MSKLWEYWNSIDNNYKNHPVQDRRGGNISLIHVNMTEKVFILENMKSQPNQVRTVRSMIVFYFTVCSQSRKFDLFF